MQRERPDVDFPVAEKNDVLKMSTSFSVTPMKGVGSMSSYNERLEWEYQDYLKQRYEEQQAAGYDGVRKIVCGGCGQVFYTTIHTKKYCHSY